MLEKPKKDKKEKKEKAKGRDKDNKEEKKDKDAKAAKKDKEPKVSLPTTTSVSCYFPAHDCCLVLPCLVLSCLVFVFVFTLSCVLPRDTFRTNDLLF